MGTKVLRKRIRGRKQKKTCDCKQTTTPIAAFIDDHSDESFLLVVCEVCGRNYLLMGLFPLTIA